MTSTTFHIFLTLWGLYHFVIVFQSLHSPEVQERVRNEGPRIRFAGYVLLLEYTIITVWAATLLRIELTQ